MTSPSLAAARELVIPTTDGFRLHARYWGVRDPKAVIIIAHGFGEHGGWYDHIARAVGPAAGVDFLAPDLRGHGRSPGRRGVVKRFEELTEDLTATLEWAAREAPGSRRFVLGHSNGGQVALRAALDARAGSLIDGLILSNPSLRVAVHVPAYKLKLARFLLRFAPGVTLAAPLDVAKLTRDPAMQKLREDDPLGHSRISAPLFFGMVEGGPLITRLAGKIHVPTLMILGGADPIIDPRASREVFDRLGSIDKTLMFYPSMLHEPFNELGREQVLADVVSWLKPRLAPVEGPRSDSRTVA